MPASPRTATSSSSHAARRRRRRHRQRRHPTATATATATATSASASTSIAAASNTATSTQHLTDVHFSSLECLSASTRRSLHDALRFSRMTRVQHAALSPALGGRDLLAKARTGTGKTLAFLLPTIEQIVQNRALLAQRRRRGVFALMIAPTRELAAQIASEASALLRFHASVGVLCVVGGTSVAKDRRRLADEASPVDVLIGTPGRLADHLAAEDLRLAERLQSLRVLVLDEADQLLERGFRADVERIIALLPSRRQTLLFSATMPPPLIAIMRSILRPEHVFINCVDDDNNGIDDDEEAAAATNAQVKQEFIVCELHEHVEVLAALLQQHMDASAAAQQPFKAIVFFSTARIAAFMAALFARLDMPVLEMHSRKSQAFRTKTAARFRSGTNMLLFSSDVSARGVDYPDVGLLVQVGLTDRQQYIHRLGRTARAGREGHGVLVLAPFDASCLLRDLDDLPLQQRSPPPIHALRERLKHVLSAVARDEALEKAAAAAYQAFLGFYNSNLKRLRWDKAQLVQTANEYSAVIGLLQPPMLLKRIVAKMGLKGVPGLRLQ